MSQQPSEDYVEVLLVPHTHPNANQPFRVRKRYQILCDSPEQYPNGVWRTVASVYKVPLTRIHPIQCYEFTFNTEKSGYYEYALVYEYEIIAAKRQLVPRRKRKVVI